MWKIIPVWGCIFTYMKGVNVSEMNCKTTSKSVSTERLEIMVFRGHVGTMKVLGRIYLPDGTTKILELKGCQTVFCYSWSVTEVHSDFETESFDHVVTPGRRSFRCADVSTKLGDRRIGDVTKSASLKGSFCPAQAEGLGNGERIRIRPCKGRSFIRIRTRMSPVETKRVLN